MTVFFRASLAALLLAISWSPSSFAQTGACTDSDGDGYGWNGVATCDPDASANDSGIAGDDAAVGACIDSDGDGYGWDGTATCTVGVSAPIADNSCVDSDGDGYGWNGTSTCLVGTTTSTPASTQPQSDGACVDSDGDGYGWNAATLSTCLLSSTEPANDDSNPTIDSDDSANDNTVADDSGNNETTNNPGGTTYTSTFSPVSGVTADQCLTRQDTINGDYPGAIIAGDFILSINAWNSGAAGNYDWEQCIFANGGGLGWTYDWGAGGGPGDFNVRSYPELIFGVKSGGEISGSGTREGTGLPARVDQLPAISIDYNFTSNQNGPARATAASVTPRFPNGSTIFGERNIAVESFFHPSDANGNCPSSVVQRGGNGSNHTYEMMVWLDSGAERLPAGPSGFVTTATIDGASWDVYTKSNDLKYVAFVARNPVLSGTVNWSAFIDWTRNNAHRVSELFGAQTNSVQLQDDWCLANILVGNEIWWGEGDFTINQWQINRTY